jgi:hypothetical protein
MSKKVIVQIGVKVIGENIFDETQSYVVDLEDAIVMEGLLMEAQAKLHALYKAKAESKKSA